MFTEEALFFFYTETPLHAGSGSSVAYVDLPIQREKHTEYPIVQAGGVKGAFRSWAGDRYQNDHPKKAELVKAFGPREGDAQSGAIAFTDAQVLLFPVRSFSGGFAWITCPFVLDRFSRMLKAAGIPMVTDAGSGAKSMETNMDELKGGPDKEGAFVADEDSPLIVNPDAAGGKKRIVLEDFSFIVDTKNSAGVNALAGWLGRVALPDDFRYIKTQLPKRLVIVTDDCFRDFVMLSTDVQTRISINDKTGIVDQGPWNEELLLADTILYSLALGKTVMLKEGKKYTAYTAEEAVAYAKGIVDTGLLQLGGDETLGRGLVRVRCLERAKPVKKEGVTNGSPSTVVEPAGTTEKGKEG